jgi:hypothetical protein
MADMNQETIRRRIRFVEKKPALKRYSPPVTGKPKCTLDIRGEHHIAKLDQKDDSGLRMVCDYSLINKVTELHLRNKG